MLPNLTHLLSISILTVFISVLLPIFHPHLPTTITTSNFQANSTVFKMGNKTAKSSTDPKTLVDEAISTYPVLIFSKTFCPYCHSAKSNIHRAGAEITNFSPPKIFELDTMGSQGRAIQSYLAKLTGRRTVPNVFIGGQSVGGGNEIAGYANRNVLKQMLTQAPDQLAEFKRGEEGEAPEEKEKKEEEKEKEEQEVTPHSLVEKAIRDFPVVIFSKSWCPFCHAAKSHISQVAPSVEGFEGAKVYELDDMDEMGSGIQSYLFQKTERNTVPNVFIGGVSVGGGDEVGALHMNGQLEGLIAAAVNAKPRNEQPGSQDDSARKLVEDAVATNPVVVFSKSYCPYCASVKVTLAQVGAEVDGYTEAKVFELDNMALSGDNVQRYLAEKTGQTTVPNVFIGGKHVGGHDAVSEYALKGELKQMLADAFSGASAPASENTAPSTKEIVFGAGCFWGVELAFQRVVGVVQTEVGYSNGHLSRVTYEAVCTGQTGSAEVVRVTYDPSAVSLTELLKIWESRHDPTSMNKQGNDVGTQYRSAVYFYDEEQAAEIAKWKADAESRLQKSIVTDIKPVNNYCPAEGYHQRYLEKKGQNAAKGATARIRCYG